MRALVPLALVLSGCASTIPVQFRFPSEEAALLASNADIAMVPVAADDLGVCPSLLGRTTFEGTVIDSVPICDLRSYHLPDPGGVVAIVVQVQDDRSTEILQGCTVVDVYPGRPPIAVDLYPTDAYAATLMRSPPPPGATLSTRCAGGS